MRIALFCHSIRSDWNHGNAHFLRGVATELQMRGHDVQVYEPANGWSATNLRRDAGEAALDDYRRVYPTLEPHVYDGAAPDLDLALAGVDVVLVHEWNDPGLIAAIGKQRRHGGRFTLLFHDSHHRSVTRPDQVNALDLSSYDGVLAFGEAIRDAYERAGWTARAWTWHEAADTRVFHPRPAAGDAQDFVWIGNWGDDERTAELEEFIWGPVSALGLTGSVYGVRYPDAAQHRIAHTSLRYRGWLPNADVPGVFADHRVTVHVPRQAYARDLPGIPTIRVFEALACGIPLVSAPWQDTEGLFRPGHDFLVARTGAEMTTHLRHVLNDGTLAAELARTGLATIAARHTCAHRVDQLLEIISLIRGTRHQLAPFDAPMPAALDPTTTPARPPAEIRSIS